MNLEDAISVYKKYKAVDILHVDLDNDGAILEEIVPSWVDKIRQLIIIEGGSKERDALTSHINSKKLTVSQWLKDLNGQEAQNLKKIMPKTSPGYQFVMVSGEEKYKKKPIKKWLEEFARKRGDIEYFTIELFPSLTLMKKR